MYPTLDRWIAERVKKYWTTRCRGARYSDVAWHHSSIQNVWSHARLATRRGSWWYHSDLATRNALVWRAVGWSPDTELACPYFDKSKRLAQVAELVADPKASVTAVFGSDRTRAAGAHYRRGWSTTARVISRLMCPAKALAGVADNVVVEVPAIVNRKGISRFGWSHCPPRSCWSRFCPKCSTWNVNCSPSRRRLLNAALERLDEPTNPLL